MRWAKECSVLRLNGCRHWQYRQTKALSWELVPATWVEKDLRLGYSEICLLWTAHHCAHFLLPPVKSCTHYLGSKGHTYENSLSVIKMCIKSHLYPVASFGICNLYLCFVWYLCFYILLPLSFLNCTCTFDTCFIKHHQSINCTVDLCGVEWTLVPKLESVYGNEIFFLIHQNIHLLTMHFRFCVTSNSAHATDYLEGCVRSHVTF